MSPVGAMVRTQHACGARTSSWGNDKRAIVALQGDQPLKLLTADRI